MSKVLNIACVIVAQPNMTTSNNLDFVDVEVVLSVLEKQVFQHTGTYLSKAQKLVIKGTWDGKDYEEIARGSDYNSYYLQQKVGPPLWLMLSEVIGGGVKVKKIHLKDILLKLVKKHYCKLEASQLDSDSLVGKTKFCGEIPKITSFYGREEDMKYLKNQIKVFNQRCISITGVGGIGKSYFVAKLVEQIIYENSNVYDYVVWKKVDRFSSFKQIINDLIKLFNLDETDSSLQIKFSLLSKHLASHRCLLVIDEFENLVTAGNIQKKVEYENLFTELTKEQNSSCTIITSQIPLKEFTYAVTDLPFLYWKLEGLDSRAAINLLREKGLDEDGCKKITEIYRGNPSELEAVAEKIHRFFGGNIESFLKYRTTVISSRFQSMLHKQFEPDGFLNNLQKNILIYLARELEENSTPVPFTKLIDDLKEQLGLQLSIFEIMADIDILEQRSLVERTNNPDKKEISYSLQPAIKKYILIDPLGLIDEKPYKLKKSTRAVNIL